MKDKAVYKRKTLAWGWLGLHKIYMEQYGVGILYMCTFGLFFMGWFKDIATLAHAGSYIDKYNTERGYVAQRYRQ